MNRLLTIIIFYAGLIAVSQGQTNRISGAFGFELGAEVDISHAPKSETTDGTPMYEITPINPHESFNQYFVLITPATHRIYCIWAIGPVMGQEKAKIQEDVVLGALVKKYGPAEKPGAFEALQDARHIDQGNRSVFLNVTGFSDAQLNLRYTDFDLKKKARDEEVEIEAKKKNNSGL